MTPDDVLSLAQCFYVDIYRAVRDIRRVARASRAGFSDGDPEVSRIADAACYEEEHGKKEQLRQQPGSECRFGEDSFSLSYKAHSPSAMATTNSMAASPHNDVCVQQPTHLIDHAHKQLCSSPSSRPPTCRETQLRPRPEPPSQSQLQLRECAQSHARSQSQPQPQSQSQLCTPQVTPQPRPQPRAVTPVQVHPSLRARSHSEPQVAPKILVRPQPQLRPHPHPLVRSKSQPQLPLRPQLSARSQSQSAAQHSAGSGSNGSLPRNIEKANIAAHFDAPKASQTVKHNRNRSKVKMGRSLSAGAGQRPQQKMLNHTIETLMPFLSRGTTICKHVINGRPHLRFFRVDNRASAQPCTPPPEPQLLWGPVSNAVSTAGRSKSDNALGLTTLVSVSVLSPETSMQLRYMFLCDKRGAVLNHKGCTVRDDMCAVFRFVKRDVAVTFLYEEDKQAWVDCLRAIVEKNNRAALKAP
ncbi:hypothetical protein ERJ75_000750500 [Trypanosoma vivax]|nr:hypothetical protein ERJ75_000750500 [Trypanosoma vivax]